MPVERSRSDADVLGPASLRLVRCVAPGSRLNLVSTQRKNMKLTWMKYPAGGWSQLNDLNLRAPQFDNLEGVYVIWHGVETGAYVRVGQGKIREKLQFHQMDPEVQAFKALSLFVTWTSVLEKFRDGVEAFLVKELRPKLGSVTPHIDPIPVNLP